MNHETPNFFGEPTDARVEHTSDVHQAYRDAVAADEAYSAIIRKLFGDKANRWTLTARQQMDPQVRAALRLKLDLDAVFFQLFRKTRETAKA